MELKVRPNPNRRVPFRRFNRTFMELKDRGMMAAIGGNGFQSHLYGIESIIIVNRLARVAVSIAPLWN